MMDRMAEMARMDQMAETELEMVDQTTMVQMVMMERPPIRIIHEIVTRVGQSHIRALVTMDQDTNPHHGANKCK